jgi:hypothetical protein
VSKVIFIFTSGALNSTQIYLVSSSWFCVYLIL